MSSGSNAQSVNPEHKLKAALIYKIPKYIVWPNISFPTKSDTLKIYFLGNSPIYGELEKYFNENEFNYCIAGLERTSDINLIKNTPHIIFVSASHQEYINKLVTKYKGSAVLVMSETQDDDYSDAHINLFLNKDGYLHFAINRKLMKDSNLQPNVKLLSLAKLVD